MGKVTRTVNKDGSISYQGSPGDTIEAAVNDMIERHGLDGLKALILDAAAKGPRGFVCGTAEVTNRFIDGNV